ncbi:hypothetical protein GCM10009665_31310 [Kitasatospora nipponensis]|uniref:Methyl-accepting chemotaxis protein n=1 Tax=Kitasatospora nipponensis TaxID=258049 RepID=A0ABN1W722_9ACTN
MVNAPVARYQDELARELESLAHEPRLLPHRGALRLLARAVESGQGLTQWAGGGLVAAYAGPDALVPDAAGAARWARRAATASSVLVFLPLLLTWTGLAFAAYAYGQQQRDGGAPATGTFLELWQQGFHGHLWEPLRFDWLVGYTLALLVALITVSILRQLWEQRDEQRAGELLRRLTGALAATEARATAAAHTEPLRFAQELQGAAQGLREIVELSTQSGERSLVLLRQAVEVVERQAEAVRSLQEAATALRAGSDQVSRVTGEAAAAAGRSGDQAQRLGDQVATAVTGLTEGVEAGTRQAAERIGAAAETAARRFDLVMTGATDRQARQAAEPAGALERRAVEQAAGLERRAVEQAAGLEQRAKAAEESLAAGRDALTEAARALGASAAGLDRAVTVLPPALADAAQEGAEHIGAAYEVAVLALATSLRGEVELAAAAIGDQLAELATLLDRQAERRESLREPPAQAPRDLPRDEPFDEPFDVPRDAPRDLPFDVPRDAPHDVPVDRPLDLR